MTFNTTERLNDTDAHLADYSLNDSCISPAHAQTGSNWAPVYGTPADGTETKHKRIRFLVQFALFYQALGHAQL